MLPRRHKFTFVHFGPERILPSRDVPALGRRNLMAGFYLGIAVTGVEALVAMGLVIAFM
jgi:hypothetical protein